MECKLTQQQYYNHTIFRMRKEKNFFLLPLWMCCCFFVNSVHHQCRIFFRIEKKSCFSCRRLLALLSLLSFLIVVVVGEKRASTKNLNHSSMIMREAVIYRLQFSFNRENFLYRQGGKKNMILSQYKIFWLYPIELHGYKQHIKI